MICSTPPKKIIRGFPFVSLQKKYISETHEFSRNMEASPGFEKAALPNPRGETTWHDRRRWNASTLSSSIRGCEFKAVEERCKHCTEHDDNKYVGIDGAGGGSYLPLKIGGLLIKKPHIQLIIVHNYWVFEMAAKKYQFADIKMDIFKTWAFLLMLSFAKRVNLPICISFCCTVNMDKYFMFLGYVVRW